MKQVTSPLLIALTLLLAVVNAISAAEQALEAIVTDRSGKPIAGAEVRLERLDAKAQPQTTISDSKGLARFKNVAVGKYKITASTNQGPVAAMLVEATLNKTTTATLSVKPGSEQVAAAPLKKRKHYVYVSEETGTHIGGGHWVAVEDNTEGTGANPVQKRDAQLLNQPQSFSLRPFTPPGQ